MKVIMTVRQLGDDNTWTETCEIPRDGASPQAVIDSFNNSLRDGETERVLVSFKAEQAVELLLMGFSEVVALPLDRIREYFEPSEKFRDFLKEAAAGSMFDLEAEEDCHFSYAVIVLEGSGEQCGIEANLPNIEAESCSECDDGEPEDMIWENGGWKCAKCGAVQ